MMNNRKKIAALSVVLVVLAAAFIFLSMKQNKLSPPSGTSSPSSSVDEIKPVDFKQDQIIRIVLRREQGEIILNRVEKEVEKKTQKEDGSFETVKEKETVWEAEGFDVNSTKIDDIALAAETVTTKRRIDENPQDIAIYGLDNPYVTTVISADGKEIGLEIGDKLPTGDGYYFKKSGSTSVYTIDLYKGNTLRSGKLDIISSIIYGTVSPNLEDITALTYTKDGKEVVFTEKDTKTGEWFIKSPLYHQADKNDFDKFLNWLVNFRVKEYVAENPAELKAYGLDEPKYLFDYTINGTVYSLRLSEAKDNICHAILEGSPYVFTVDASQLTFVDLSAFEIAQAYIFIPNINDVEKLIIEMDGRTDELLIKTDTVNPENDAFSLNGSKIEEKNKDLFKRYYQGAISIAGTKLDLDAIPTGEAEIRLTYTMKKAGRDGKVVVVELIPTEDGYGYYLVKNGVYPGLVMSERSLDKSEMIREAYNNLMDAIK